MLFHWFGNCGGGVSDVLNMHALRGCLIASVHIDDVSLFLGFILIVFNEKVLYCLFFIVNNIDFIISSLLVGITLYLMIHCNSSSTASEQMTFGNENTAFYPGLCIRLSLCCWYG